MDPSACSSGKFMGSSSIVHSWMQSPTQCQQGFLCVPLHVELLLSGSRWISSMLPEEMGADSSKFICPQLSNTKGKAFVFLSICMFAGDWCSLGHITPLS